MRAQAEIFRAYDIRGKVGANLDEETAAGIGKAFGTRVQREGGSRVAVGRDNRLSSDAMRDALVEGLLSTGCAVTDIGLATSPLLYHAVAEHGFDGGINVSGSHNPPDENGFKLVGKGALPIAGDEIQDLYRAIIAGDFATGRGGREEMSVTASYFEYVRRHIGPLEPFTVVVDTGNGVAGKFYPEFLGSLGCNVVEQHCDLDGHFPNHPPDPQMPENVRDLQEKVREERADIGLAFDGDGDRLGVIDDAGERHEADYIVLLLARDVLHALPGSEIVLDMKTSQGVIDAIAAAGGRPLLWKTGHSLIKLKMRQIHAILGGEASGHMFYAENHFLDDALWAAAKLLAYLTRRRSSVRLELADVPPWYATPELRVPCADEVKEAVVQRVAARYSKLPSLSIDGIRVQFPDGWGLVRASNTGPNLTLRFEAKSPARRDEIQAEMTAAVQAELSA